ncbi:MAG: alpha/beta hydrolase [Flavisolibacter sp.]
MVLPKQLVLKYLRTKFVFLSSISKRKAAEEAFKLFCTPQVRKKSRLPGVFVTAENLVIDFKEYRISGYRWNKGGQRKVLILHGFESTVANFEKYVNELVKKDYQVLAFDAPAHGYSSGKTIDAVVYKNLVQFIWMNFGPIDSFLTHSFGGLALCLALEDIPHPALTRIVLIAPAVETKTAIDNFFAYLQLPSFLRTEFDAIIEERGGRSTEWYSVARAAPQIKGQVLFLQDKDDVITPLSDVRPIMDRNYSNFNFIITEGLGHRRIYRDEQSVKRIVDFL